jgi:hypothetical protein
MTEEAPHLIYIIIINLQNLVKRLPRQQANLIHSRITTL